MSTLIAAIADIILFACILYNVPSWVYLIPGLIGIFVFMQGMRHLRFQTGMAKFIRIMGVAIAAFASGLSFLQFYFSSSGI